MCSPELHPNMFEQSQMRSSGIQPCFVTAVSGGVAWLRKCSFGLRELLLPTLPQHAHQLPTNVSMITRAADNLPVV